MIIEPKNARIQLSDMDSVTVSAPSSLHRGPVAWTSGNSITVGVREIIGIGYDFDESDPPHTLRLYFGEIQVWDPVIGREVGLDDAGGFPQIKVNWGDGSPMMTYYESAGGWDYGYVSHTYYASGTYPVTLHVYFEERSNVKWTPEYLSETSNVVVP